jgi:Hemolysins and related proteins containing CBS domains
MEPEVTEEEIKILIEQGTRSGIVEEAEQNIVGRVFELGDRQVRSLMTPRPEIFWIDIDDSAEENRQSIAQKCYTRISSLSGRFRSCFRRTALIFCKTAINCISCC